MIVPTPIFLSLEHSYDSVAIENQPSVLFVVWLRYNAKVEVKNERKLNLII